MYSCFVHLLYLDRLSWANVIKWKGSLRSPSLFTPDFIVVVLSIYIRRELNSLAHRTAIPQIWYHYGPSPHPGLVNVVQAGLEMIQLDFNIVFLEERGVFEVAKCFQELYLETKHGNIHFS